MKSFAFVFLALALALETVSASPFVHRSPDEYVTPLIVGGIEAQKGEFPFLVEIRHVLSPGIGGQWCGGSIVNLNWIVTAAHCVHLPIDGYTIVAGQHRLRLVEGTEQERGVAQITIHPNYDNNANDIAVVRVDAPFAVNQWVQQATLATPGFRPVGDVVVTGWGDLEYGGASPDILMRVSVPMVTDEACRQAYGSGFQAGMICAGTAGKDSCQGDSGGPLLSGDILAGIVSKGFECARPGYPGVYTEVAYFYDWIIQNT